MAQELFIPRVVRVTMENASDEYPHTIIEEGLLFREGFVISRLEKQVDTGQVTLGVRHVERHENSGYYNGGRGGFLELVFTDSEDLLPDAAELTFVEFMDKYLWG
ncbi:hypothetical protein [Tumebacillus avium]|nr:hypothetical protein [Tumebacillus avium]